MYFQYVSRQHLKRFQNCLSRLNLRSRTEAWKQAIPFWKKQNDGGPVFEPTHLLTSAERRHTVYWIRSFVAQMQQDVHKVQTDTSDQYRRNWNDRDALQ
jgi:branched-subunit amino acid aminotransferase/4-amino-4-deoxychorismate lyase